MKSFTIKADATFEAENIDDAFRRLSEYYNDLYIMGDPAPLFTSGQVEIKPSNV